MGSQVNKIVIGEYTVNGGAVVYGDTDSISVEVMALKQKYTEQTLSSYKEQMIIPYDSTLKD